MPLCFFNMVVGTLRVPTTIKTPEAFNCRFYSFRLLNRDSEIAPTEERNYQNVETT